METSDTSNLHELPYSNSLELGITGIKPEIAVNSGDLSGQALLDYMLSSLELVGSSVEEDKSVPTATHPLLAFLDTIPDVDQTSNVNVVRKGSNFVSLNTREKALQMSRVAAAGASVVLLSLLVSGGVGKLVKPNVVAQAVEEQSSASNLLPLPDITVPTTVAPRLETTTTVNPQIEIQRLQAKAAAELAEKTRIKEEKIANTPDSAKIALAATKICGYSLELEEGPPIRSPYGYRFHPVDKVYKMHTGVDLACEEGNSVFSRGGTVVQAGWNGGYGNSVSIKNADGTTELFAHLLRAGVSVGDTVTANKNVGPVGCTGSCSGPHVHYEITDTDGNTVNPQPSLIAYGAGLIG